MLQLFFPMCLEHWGLSETRAPQNLMINPYYSIYFPHLIVIWLFHVICFLGNSKHHLGLMAPLSNIESPEIPGKPNLFPKSRNRWGSDALHHPIIKVKSEMAPEEASHGSWSFFLFERWDFRCIILYVHSYIHIHHYIMYDCILVYIYLHSYSKNDFQAWWTSLCARNSFDLRGMSL
jgi:hypothetical protein